MSAPALLVVSATEMETALLRERLGARRTKLQLPFGVDYYESENGAEKTGFLATGVGMVNTAFTMGAAAPVLQPGFLLNVGIAGTYDAGTELTSVFEIQEDAFADFGAESPDGFLDLEQMGFPGLKTPDGKNYYNVLANPYAGKTGFPLASAITKNAVSGRDWPEIEAVRARWGFRLESMEGAAFFHAALAYGAPFAVLRAVSNYVEPRDKSRWKLTEAVSAAQLAALEFIGNRR